jgi:hypothetical protein
MLARQSLRGSAFDTSKSLRIRTYKSPSRQLLCPLHLRALPASVHSKAPTSPAESALTRFPSPNPFVFRTYRKPGKGPAVICSSHPRLLPAFAARSLDRSFAAIRWGSMPLVTVRGSLVASHFHPTPLYATFTKNRGRGVPLCPDPLLKTHYMHRHTTRCYAFPAHPTLGRTTHD